MDRAGLKKEKKYIAAISINGKATKSRLKYEKLAKLQRDAMDSYKSGLGYESGLALAAAVKSVKNSPMMTKQRNPPGTPKEKLRCKYHHPNFCAKLGHRDARSHDCEMKYKSTKERNEAEKIIFHEAVQKELEMMSILRK